MQRIATWLAEPTTRQRHDIMREALWAGAQPSVLLGLAVGWSTGGPAPNDAERSPVHKTPVVLNSAVLSLPVAGRAGAPLVLPARFLDMAEALFRAY